MLQRKLELKVGFFAALILVLLVYATLKVGEGNFFIPTGYELVVQLDNAMGLNEKTPVEIAGISVGYVKKVELAADGRHARAHLQIDRPGATVAAGTKAVVRARGFLGDSYIALVPGPVGGPTLEPGAELEFGGVGGDMSLVLTDFGEVAKDFKAISQSLREQMAGDNAPVNRIIHNLDTFSATIRELVVQNQRNIDAMVANFAALSRDLRGMATNVRPDLEESFSRVASISRKLDEGEGTIGQLINNKDTVNKVNDAADSLTDALGGFKKLQTEVGYHTEYLGGTKDFKHYVHLNLHPRPDEGFLLEFVEDRTASPNRATRTSTVTANGQTTAVSAETTTLDQNKFRVSAQLAKKFYNLTLRGGIIENRGGVGFDYDVGRLGLSASAFDFNTKNGNKPHLKFMGTARLTPSLFLVGGMDDPLNPNQKKDWFVGAGLKFVDEDIKSLLAGGLGAAVKK
ncbi:MAG: MCE family protein [Deltaproteobacteria bacterium]|nr:MCE family protein [Deltaproteobacteria bacterium]